MINSVGRLTPSQPRMVKCDPIPQKRVLSRWGQHELQETEVKGHITMSPHFDSYPTTDRNCCSVL